MLQAVRFATGAATTLAVVALFVMMLMTFVDVILRSTINQPLEAATELTRILMAIMVFSALPVMSVQGKHITVDLLDHLMPQWLRNSADALIAIICGALLLWPAARCRVLAERARDYGDVTEYLAIPTFLLAWFVTISVFITAVALMVRGLISLFRPSLIQPVDNNA